MGGGGGGGGDINSLTYTGDLHICAYNCVGQSSCNHILKTMTQFASVTEPKTVKINFKGDAPVPGAP